MRPFSALGLAGAVVALTGCGQPQSEALIQRALSSPSAERDNLAKLFPDRPGSFQGMITSGPGVTTYVTYETRVTAARGLLGPAIVRLTESWELGYPRKKFCHTWQFEVGPAGARLVRNDGASPPQEWA